MTPDEHQRVDREARRLDASAVPIVRDPATGLDYAECGRCGFPQLVRGPVMLGGCPFCGSFGGDGARG